MKANWLEIPRSPGHAAAVQFVVSNRPNRTVEVLVDPVSLKLLGSSELIRRGPVMAFMVRIHEFLMMSDRIGLPAVGWTAVAMTFMALSGIILWWPRKGRWLAAFLVKRGARGLRLHLDLHHAAGIWGLLIFLVLSVSGIYLAFPQTVSGAVRAAFPNVESAAMPIPPGFPKTWPIPPEEAVANRGMTAVPDADPVGILLPRTPKGAADGADGDARLHPFHPADHGCLRPRRYGHSPYRRSAKLSVARSRVEPALCAAFQR